MPMMPMPNKMPKFFDKHKICIICEGNEEYQYLKRLKDLKVWNEQYDISLVNAGGNGNIPARYQQMNLCLYFVIRKRNRMSSTKISNEKLTNFMA